MEKIDARKSFKLVEKQMKHLYDIILSKMDEMDSQDAMLMKKPLGGYSCVNCSKNLINLSGSMVEHQISGKFPFRDPHDRLNKAGPGFSKVLQSMRPESS